MKVVYEVEAPSYYVVQIYSSERGRWEKVGGFTTDLERAKSFADDLAATRIARPRVVEVEKGD